MLIMVAGPYSAATAEARRRNLDRLNNVAAQVLRRGHVPVLGVNAALPVIERSPPSEGARAMMDISLGLAERCDAVLMVAESPGANREREVFVRRGRPVYWDVAELPDADTPPPTDGGDGEVTLATTTPDDLSPLQNLMQLYTYEFSEMLALDVGPDGLFPRRDLSSWWADPLRAARFIRVGAELAGFALVERRSRLSDDLDVVDMGEFFVLRRHRRRGVGARAAALAFDAFRGRWEVRQLARNAAATAFWRAAIGRYTGGDYREARVDDDRWRGVVHSFDNRRA